MSGNRAAATLISMIIGLLAAGSAIAGPLEEGQAAWAKGDYGRAMALLRPLADRGVARAQGLVGWMYDDGLGVSQDKAKAAAYYEKAAAQGDVTARNNLGVMLQNGDGVPANPTRAADLYEASAATGDATGQFNLGWALVNGVGRPKDLEKGYSYFRRAAAQGNLTAKDSLPNADLPGGGQLKLGDFTVSIEQREGEPVYRLEARRTIPDIRFESKINPGVALILDLAKPIRVRGYVIEVNLKWDERVLSKSRLNFSLLTAEVDCVRHRVREGVVYNLFKASAGGGGGVGAPDYPDWSQPASDGPYDQAMTRVCQFRAFVEPDLPRQAAAPPSSSPAEAAKETQGARR